jgi:hypothetical protein
MSQNTSRDELLQFLEYLGAKGLVAPPTATARRIAASRVLSVLSDEEAENVFAVDLDHLMSRFENLNRGKFTPDSLRTYRSRLKTALDDFRGYNSDPVSFRPSGRTSGKNKQIETSKPRRKDSYVEIATPSASSSSTPAINMPNTNQLPIALRQDVVVRVFGLPFDLSKAEAQKIANIILAHAPSE